MDEGLGMERAANLRPRPWGLPPQVLARREARRQQRAAARRVAALRLLAGLMLASILSTGTVMAWQRVLGPPGVQVAGVDLGWAPRLSLDAFSRRISERRLILHAASRTLSVTAAEAGLAVSSAQLWAGLQARVSDDPFKADRQFLAALSGDTPTLLAPSVDRGRWGTFRARLATWVFRPVEEPWVGLQGTMVGLRTGTDGYSLPRRFAGYALGRGGLAGLLINAPAGDFRLPLHVLHPQIPYDRALSTYTRVRSVLAHQVVLNYNGRASTLDGVALASVLRIGSTGPTGVAIDLSALSRLLDSRVTSWDSEGDVLTGAPQVIIDTSKLAHEVGARLGLGGTVSASSDAVVTAPQAVTLAVPVVQQGLLNDCEAAAASMLLQAKGFSVSQDTLVSDMPYSGGSVTWSQAGDPQWGDPNAGFVGAPDGSGPSGWGGYGIYHQPMAATLALHAPGRVADLSGGDVAALEQELQAGNAVMVWATVDWSDHLPWTWQLPSGATFEGDRSEHAVVLTGVAPGGFYYNDPYYGTSGAFVSATTFSHVWDFMGRQALAIR